MKRTASREFGPQTSTQTLQILDPEGTSAVPIILRFRPCTIFASATVLGLRACLQ